MIPRPTLQAMSVLQEHIANRKLSREWNEYHAQLAPATRGLKGIKRIARIANQTIPLGVITRIAI